MTNRSRLLEELKLTPTSPEAKVLNQSIEDQDGEWLIKWPSYYYHKRQQACRQITDVVCSRALVVGYRVLRISPTTIRLARY